jgi:hypothetical protein
MLIAFAAGSSGTIGSIAAYIAGMCSGLSLPTGLLLIAVAGIRDVRRNPATTRQAIYYAAIASVVILGSSFPLLSTYPYPGQGVSFLTFVCAVLGGLTILMKVNPGEALLAYLAMACVQFPWHFFQSAFWTQHWSALVFLVPLSLLCFGWAVAVLVLAKTWRDHVLSEERREHTFDA